MGESDDPAADYPDDLLTDLERAILDRLRRLEEADLRAVMRLVDSITRAGGKAAPARLEFRGREMR